MFHAKPHLQGVPRQGEGVTPENLDGLKSLDIRKEIKKQKKLMKDQKKQGSPKKKKKIVAKLCWPQPQRTRDAEGLAIESGTSIFDRHRIYGGTKTMLQAQFLNISLNAQVGFFNWSFLKVCVQDGGSLGKNTSWLQ